MSIFTPTVIITLLLSTATQVVGALLIPQTKGLTALWPTVGMFLGFGVGIGLLARVVHSGVNLSIALPPGGRRASPFLDSRRRGIPRRKRLTVENPASGQRLRVGACGLVHAIRNTRQYRFANHCQRSLS